jgi:hypothetical protein
MTILPTAYLAPIDWYRAYLLNPMDTQIEVMESFEKQTFRNRCTITTPDGPLMLSIPIKKVDHKQLTRDIEISYQQRWQHQHWIALMSAYKHTPYFDYYAEFFKPFYECETRWLVDLNNDMHEIIMQLLHNSAAPMQGYAYQRTQDWQGKRDWSGMMNKQSILDMLFEYGPETMKVILDCRLQILDCRF